MSFTPGRSVRIITEPVVYLSRNIKTPARFWLVSQDQVVYMNVSFDVVNQFVACDKKRDSFPIVTVKISQRCRPIARPMSTPRDSVFIGNETGDELDDELRVIEIVSNSGVVARQFLINKLDEKDYPHDLQPDPESDDDEDDIGSKNSKSDDDEDDIGSWGDGDERCMEEEQPLESDECLDDIE